MHKFLKIARRVFTPLLMIAGLSAFLSDAHASADRQSFLGFGPGVEVVSNDGSGTGFYFQGFGGYSFNSILGLGLHLGYSNVGGIGLRVLDFGSFLQLAHADSGLYGRFYLDGIYASTSSGGTAHGVNDSQVGFAPGVGVGMMIPPLGSFHLVGEITYRVAMMESPVHIIAPSLGVMWDF